jgi:DNA-binding transcriptional ArsR family regulator
MHCVPALDLLGEPARRRILELLAGGEKTSGALSAVVQREFGITQPAVSLHLRVLRDGGLVTVRPEGARRVYAVNPAQLREMDLWLDGFRHFWTPYLDRLELDLQLKRRRRGRTSGAPGKRKRNQRRSL